MSENTKSIQYLAEKARLNGYDTFTHSVPCKRCKTSLRYSKGRSGCVKCNKKAKKYYIKSKTEFTPVMTLSAKHLSAPL